MTKVYIVVEVFNAGYGSDESWKKNLTVYLNRNLAKSFADCMSERKAHDFKYIVEEHEVIE